MAIVALNPGGGEHLRRAVAGAVVPPRLLRLEQVVVVDRSGRDELEQRMGWTSRMTPLRHLRLAPRLSLSTACKLAASLLHSRYILVTDGACTLPVDMLERALSLSNDGPVEIREGAAPRRLSADALRGHLDSGRHAGSWLLLERDLLLDRYARGGSADSRQSPKTGAQDATAMPSLHQQALASWRDQVATWRTLLNSDSLLPDGETPVGIGSLLAADRPLPRAGRILQRSLERHHRLHASAVERARKASADGNWPLALETWKSVIDDFAEAPSVEAFCELTKAQCRMRLLQEAEETARRGLQCSPKHVGLRIEHAEVAMARGDWVAAIERWRNVLDRLGPKAAPKVYVRLSIAYRHARAFAEAESTIAAGMRIYPARIDIAAEWAEVAMAQRKWKDSIDRWNHTQRLFSGVPNPRSFLRIAHAQRNQLDLAAAEQQTHHGLALHPDSPELLRCAAEIAMARRDWSSAANRWSRYFAVLHFTLAAEACRGCLVGAVADWRSGDWRTLARLWRNGELDIAPDSLCPGTLLCVADVLASGGYGADALPFLEFALVRFPANPLLQLRAAEFDLQSQRWDRAEVRLRALADEPDYIARVAFCRLCLAQFMGGDPVAARSTSAAVEARFPDLAGLFEEYALNERFLRRMASTSAPGLDLRVLLVDPASTLGERVAFGGLITEEWISENLRLIGDRIGHVDASWGGRFSRLVARRMSYRFAQQFHERVAMEVGALADAVYHIFSTELSHVIPLRHLARKIAAARRDDVVMIKLRSTDLAYLNYWADCDLEPLYIYAELVRLKVPALLVLDQRGSGDDLHAAMSRSTTLRFSPSQRWRRKSSVHHDGSIATQRDVLVVPDSIRGIEKIVERLKGAHVLTSTSIVLARPYSTCNPVAPIPFTATLYEHDLPLEEFGVELAGEAIAVCRTHTGERRYAQLQASSEPVPTNLFNWLFRALERPLAQLSRSAQQLVERDRIRHVHIADHLGFESSIVAAAVRRAGGKVTLWPHGSAPVHNNLRRPDEVDEVVCMVRSAEPVLRQSYPGAKVSRMPELMFEAPGSTSLLPARQSAARRLSVVIIGGVFTMGRMPRLRMSSQVDSYKSLFKALRRLQPDVDVYYKGKGAIEEGLSWLDDLSDAHYSWPVAMNHPVELDLPNMVYLSVTFGSSALMEGIGRGVPGMIVRDFPVEDYTLIDPGVIPVGTTPQIVAAIEQCLDHDHRMALISRQMAYYAQETRLG